MRKLQGEPTNPVPRMEETLGVGEVEAATSREGVQIDSAPGATLRVVVVLSALLLDRSLGFVEGRREKRKRLRSHAYDYACSVERSLDSGTSWHKSMLRMDTLCMQVITFVQTFGLLVRIVTRSII